MNIQRAGLWRNGTKLFAGIAAAGFLASVLISVALTLIPQLAFAAIPSDAALEKQGAASAECVKAAALQPSMMGEEDSDQQKTCGKHYVAGYKNPAGNADALKKYCEDNSSAALRSLCRAGYPKGQADRKAYDKDQATPRPTNGNLTDAQIKALAESHPTCAVKKKTDNGLGSTNGGYTACVAGYVAGYKGIAQPTSGACGVYDNSCKTGYDLGKAMKAQNIRTASEQAAAAGSAAPGDAEEDNPLDPCDELGKLAWIVCPVAKATTTAIEKLDNGINDLLTIGTARIFCTAEGPECTAAEAETGRAYKTAWNSFRVFALGMVVVAALVVIIASAFGFEILDAYTIRKVLPRVLIATIFIVLSWEILEFLIMLSNDVGNGLRALIYAPFRDIGDAGMSASTGFLANGLLVGGLFALGPLGLLSFGVTALLAVLLAFLVLILRELIVIFLVVVAPIGIACLILPNTRKGWQFWQTTLTAMLVAFPLIAAMIATGRVFAITTANSGDGIITEVISFSAYLLPYFMLPFAFRMAGGLLATLGGLANDRSRGAFDRLSKFRQGRMSKIHEKRMTGNSWMGTGRTGNMYRRAAAAGEHGSWNPTRRGRARWQEESQKRFADQADQAIKEHGDRAFADDDTSAILRQRGLTRNQAIQQIMAATGRDARAAEQALTRAEQATGTRVGSDQMAVAALKYRMSHTNTAYGSGVDAMMEMRRDAREAIDNGLITVDDATAWMKSNQGRGDFSSNSYGATRDFLTANVNDRASAHAQLDGAFQGADPRAILGSHQNGIVSFATAAQRRLTFAQDALTQAQATGDQNAIANAQMQADYALADVANIHNALSSVSPNKANEFANNVLSQPSGRTAQVPILGANGQPMTDAAGNTLTQTGPVSFRQLIEEARNNPQAHSAFHDRSREYASARQANAAGANAQPEA